MELKKQLYEDVIDKCITIINGLFSKENNYLGLVNSLKTAKLLIHGLESLYNDKKSLSDKDISFRIKSNLDGVLRAEYPVDHALVEFVRISYFNDDEIISRKTKSSQPKRLIPAYIQDVTSFVCKNSDWEIVAQRIKEQYPLPLGDKDRPLTFLCYAFADNIFALYLFDYFWANGGYLYVDSLMGEPLTIGKDIKESLSPIIDKSEQFLFLKTVNSYNKQIRQWCAWEIGYSYDKIGSNNSYYISSDLVMTKLPILIDDFKTMHGVDLGMIY